MPRQQLIRAANLASHSSFTGGLEEITGVSNRPGELRVHDSATVGGWLVAKTSYATKSVAGATDVTLTEAEGCHSTLVFTGELTGNISVILPVTLNNGREWKLRNSTSGSFTLTAKGPTGTGIVLPQNSTMITVVVYDGTNIVEIARSLGLTTPYTANAIIYASSTTALSMASTLTWDGTTLTVDGNLTFTGAQTIATSTGNLTISTSAGNGNILITPNGTGDLIVNTTHLVVDTSAARVGIGTASPSQLLHVYMATANSNAIIAIESTVSNGYGAFINYIAKTTAGVSQTWNVGVGILDGAASWTLYNTTDSITSIVAFTTGNVAIGTTTATTSALLNLSSTTGALLLTRLTTTQRDLLTAVNGMILYNSTLNKVQIYEGGAWASVI